jgi:hypothetical protein
VRTRKRLGRDRDEGLWSLAGWVFADSLLALAVVFLATQKGAVPVEVVSPPPTTEPPRPSAVDSRYICFRVVANPDLLTAAASPAPEDELGRIAQQVQSRLAEPDLKGRRAGIVLTFGVANSPGPGTARADAFDQAILPRFPGAFRQPDSSLVVSRAFWGGNPTQAHPDGSIEVNIYPVIEGTHEPLGASASSDC